MNDAFEPPFVNRASGAGMAFLTVVVLLVVITFAARLVIPTLPVDATRAYARSKALADIRATEETSLHTAGWVDQDRQIVRLPVTLAMQMTVQLWQNPESARADLIARGVKATAPLAKTPPKPSAFE